jgi:hypothetical protein
LSIELSDLSLFLKSCSIGLLSALRFKHIIKKTKVIAPKVIAVTTPMMTYPLLLLFSGVDSSFG